MSKKICNKCQEINSGSAMICSNCHNTLSDAKIIKEASYETDVHGIIESGNNDSKRNVIYTSDSDVISMGTWVGILIALSIPFVNIVALLIMAFGRNNENIKNYAKANLILVVIALVLLFLIRGCSRLY